MRFAAAVVVAALAAAASAESPDKAPPPVDVKLPAAAAQAVEAFRDVPWAERCKPARAEPAPDGWQRRVKAEAALAALTRQDASALWTLLADSDRFVRALAARGLGLAADPANAHALASALSFEKDKLARVAMIEALARTGGAEALAAVESQQTAGADADVSWMVGLARRQLKGGAWDVANLRAEFVDAARATFAVAEIGKPAPELALPSPDKPVNLAPYLGKVVVVAFTHGDRDAVGEKVLQRLGAEKERLDRLDVQVIVVDPHEKERTAVWSKRLDLPFVLASDPASRAASAYGVAKQMVVGGEWQPSPAWFVVDRKGVLVWEKIGKSEADHASLGELLPVLDKASREVRLTER